MKLSLALALLCSTFAAHAANIEIGGCDGGASGLTTCQVGATVIDFDAGMPANFSTYSGSGGQVVTGSLANQYATPANDTTPFLAVPSSTSVGAVDAYFGGTYNYFGIYWGSIDDFNSLTFLNNGVSIGTFSGADVLANSALEGNQIAPGSNEYVNFFFGAQTYTTIIDTSSNYAFESDNWAVGNNAPEPLSAGLLGLGVLGAALAVRRRRSTLAGSAA
jgi:MYXO-CTERM domain-containing protein